MNEVLIKDKIGRKIMMEQGFYPPDIPRYIVDKFARAIAHLCIIDDIRDMDGYPGYNPVPKEAERKGYRAINLDKQWRLLFKIDHSTRPITIFVDYFSNRHYKK